MRCIQATGRPAHSGPPTLKWGSAGMNVLAPKTSTVICNNVRATFHELVQQRAVRLRTAAAAPQEPAAEQPLVEVQPEVVALAQQPAAATTAAAPRDGMSLLTNTQPIDRLRYQALLIFEQLDTSHTGRLSGEQLASFVTSCSRKVSWSPGLAEVLTSAAARWAHLSASGCDAEQFVGLVRDQVHAVSTSPAYQSSMMRPDVAARLQAQMSLSVQELAAARWVFGLLDADGDGALELSMYAGVRGIEAYVFEDKIEDADADGDGRISFEEFLVSYAKPKPIGKNLLIMAVNTAVVYLILQAPWLDVMIKVVLVGALVLKPALVSRPAALVYDAVKAIIDQGRAQAEVAKASRGVWRPA